MLPYHVALVSAVSTAEVTESELNQVAAALQKQATRDFGPLWDIEATVDAFAALDDVPIDYWPIIVRNDINAPGAAGFHQDENGQPYSLVQYSSSWSLTASHECLEMLADPSGNRTIAGVAPDLYVEKNPNGSARVSYLMEICDPCEDSQFAYTINGIVVSDFITPHFYDPVASTSVRYSFQGSVTEPHQVLEGGYISFSDPVHKKWYQIQYFDGGPNVVSLSMPRRGAESLRSMIDKLTHHTELEHGISKPATVEALRMKRQAAQSASAARAKSLTQQITTLGKSRG